MKLYSYYRSSSAWRVRTVLELKGLPYDYHPVNLAPGVCEQRAPEFASINPLQQVPTLEWTENGRVHRLTQSVAIVEYLEELHPGPPLLPRAPFARALVRQIVELVASGIQPLQNTGTLAAVGGLTSPEGVRDWARSCISRGLSALETFARASGGLYAVGDEVTLADVFIVPQVYNARRFEVPLAAYPKVVEIDARACALPAFERAHPDRQIDSPANAAAR
jgi:maleylpyruvate isomerase